MTFSGYGRCIDSIAMAKIIAAGRKLVQKEKKDGKMSLGAKMWGNRAQTYAVVLNSGLIRIQHGVIWPTY